MAKILSKTGIITTSTIEAGHVTQSIDALTGAVAYDITISGSLNTIGTTSGSFIGDGAGLYNLPSTDTSSLTPLSAFNTFTSSYNTGSFTGSFKGDGTGLYNLPPADTSFLVTTSSFNAFTSSYVQDSGSVSTRLTDLESFSSSLDNTFVSEVEFGTYTSSINTFTSSYSTGSFTGSFIGDGSGLTGVSASNTIYDANGIIIGDREIDGNLNTSTLYFYDFDWAELDGNDIYLTANNGIDISAATGDISISPGSNRYSIFQRGIVRLPNNLTPSASYPGQNGLITYNGTSHTVDIFSGFGAPLFSGSWKSLATTDDISNIYNTDGTLTGFRQIDGNNNDLYINNLPNFLINNPGSSSLSLSHKNSNFSNSQGELFFNESEVRLKTLGFPGGQNMIIESVGTLNITSEGNFITSVGTSSYFRLPTNPNVLSNVSFAQNGSILYDDTTNSFKARQNSSWETIAVLGDITSGNFATTGSNTFNGDQIINGNITVHGTASADVLITNYQSSSIIYSSGSTKFGDTLDDTHEFTGSVFITGSDVTLVGGTFNGDGSGLTNIQFNTSSLTTLTVFNSFTSSYYTDSGSVSTRITDLEGFSSSLDNTFVSEVEFNVYTSSINSFTSSIQTEVNNLTAATSSYALSTDLNAYTTTSSFNSFTSSYNTGSFTGSFQGDGSGLTGVIAKLSWQ